MFAISLITKNPNRSITFKFSEITTHKQLPSTFLHYSRNICTFTNSSDPVTFYVLNSVFDI